MCYKAGGMNEGVDLEGRRESENYLPDCQTDTASEFPGNTSGMFITEIK